VGPTIATTATGRRRRGRRRGRRRTKRTKNWMVRGL
jgi:hypothetical protein